MKKVLSVLLVAGATPLFAQGMKSGTAGGAVAMLNHSYTSVDDYITQAAEQVPESDYGFKPTPPARSFGQIVARVAETKDVICSGVLADKNPGPDIEKTKSIKAAIVEALKGSSALCSKAYAIPDTPGAHHDESDVCRRPRHIITPAYAEPQKSVMTPVRLNMAWTTTPIRKFRLACTTQATGRNATKITGRAQGEKKW
jgi:hypothetical protein